LLRDILSGKDAQIAAFVRVIRHIDPDILVLADVDYDHGGAALTALASLIDTLPNQFAAQPNSGLQSGADLNGDGRLGRAEDAWGFGDFAGQGGLALLSKYPIERVIDHSQTKWIELSATLALPDTYIEQPLSTRSHWEVSIGLPDGQVLTVLTWHATAPVFDGPEDRNGRRNHDEAAFWVHRLDHAPPPNPIIAGFANLDPIDGDGRPAALSTLLAHTQLQDPQPKSDGAFEAAATTSRHRGPPQLDTVDWPDDGPGNLRVDYVLPARSFTVLDAGVFWPPPGKPFAEDVARASRHRVVWVDVRLPSN
jgi:hypothetical protein